MSKRCNPLDISGHHYILGSVMSTKVFCQRCGRVVDLGSSGQQQLRDEASNEELARR